jgi:hypothetical protein
MLGPLSTHFLSEAKAWGRVEMKLELPNWVAVDKLKTHGHGNKNGRLTRASCLWFRL